MVDDFCQVLVAVTLDARITEDALSAWSGVTAG
jgi:hypothetical protein